jgi:mono/diheme cytochrome c family protein
MIVLEVLVIAIWLAQRQVRAPAIGSAERGRLVAERSGCFACHGAGGNGGVFNPSAEGDELPAWGGRTLMMYANDEDEIREWILDGAPKRLLDDRNYLEQREKSLIHMPEFRGRMSQAELTDLIRYVKAVSWFVDPPSDLIATGRDVALINGCFGCHGPSGQGRLANPGSFKGYVPGWDGADFRELVKNDVELEEWILDGISRRFKRNPGAQIFLKRQIIKMPAYREQLSKSALGALMAYINWVQGSSVDDIEQDRYSE